MKYFTEHTGYAGALDCLQSIGGQLFPGKRRDSTSTVVAGKCVYTFWEPNSKNYHKCAALAADIGFPHEHFTSGRIAKFLLESVCGINPNYGTPDPVFVKLASDGFHWHYTHVETGYHPYLIEFDLCAAYATSLVQFDSPYFAMNQKITEGHSEMASLRVVLETVPKWMRLILIGQMATHRMTFATMPNRVSGDFTLKWNTIRRIKYGYAFNRTHQAILRVYRVLQRIHSISDIWCKRIHTDSFALSADTPVETESKVFEYLDSTGFRYSVKAQGSSHFFCLNSGIIGRKFVGVPFEIREQIAALPERPRRLFLTPEQLERWGVRGVSPDTTRAQGETESLSPVQLELIETNGEERQSRYERFA